MGSVGLPSCSGSAALRSAALKKWIDTWLHNLTGRPQQAPKQGAAKSTRGDGGADRGPATHDEAAKQAKRKAAMLGSQNAVRQQLGCGA